MAWYRFWGLDAAAKPADNASVQSIGITDL